MNSKVPLYSIGQILTFKNKPGFKIVTGRRYNELTKTYTYLVSDLPEKATMYDEEWLDIIVDHTPTRGHYQDVDGYGMKGC